MPTPFAGVVMTAAAVTAPRTLRPTPLSLLSLPPPRPSLAPSLSLQSGQDKTELSSLALQNVQQQFVQDKM